jgi:large subunit ribosomal protein L19
MQSVTQRVEEKHKKKAVVDVRSGDTVKVHQKIREGGKERVQIFEGMIIKTGRKNSFTSTFTVRRIASGVGVEKTYLIHSPSVLKIEVVKRSKVRRNYLSYMRNLTGKNARLAGVDFDKEAVNVIHDEQAEAEEEKIHEQKAEIHEAAQEQKAVEEKEREAKVEVALAQHEQATAKPKTEEAKQPTKE